MEKKVLWNAAGQGARLLNRLTFPLQKDDKTLIRFDTSIGTENLGDNIIMHYCDRVLDELFPEYGTLSVGTHSLPTPEQERAVKQARYKIVCGTNLLTSHIEHHWRWILPDGFRQKWNYRNVILLGVGWGEYQDECSDYSRMIYRAMLNPGMLHSVRDEYTLKKLYRAGFRNVVNTGCPTTWALTPEFCKGIPTGKAREVVATITDYRRDPERDSEILAILGRNYDHIHLWLQGKQDGEYLQTLNVPANLTTIPATLADYEAMLQPGKVDYVGTRLHAGIHALNHGVRSIILAVDNRATEMSRDVNLPVLKREDVGKVLEQQINRDFSTEIHINQENIHQFKAQFLRE